MRILLPIAACCVALSLTACSSSPQESIGALIGSGARSLGAEQAAQVQANNEVAAASVPAQPLLPQSRRQATLKAVGGIGDSRFSQLLVDGDAMLASNTEFHALDAGAANVPYGWSNDRTGHSGVVVAGSIRHIGGRECRPVQHTLKFATPPRVVFGTGCRLATGGWQIM